VKISTGGRRCCMLRCCMLWGARPQERKGIGGANVNIRDYNGDTPRGMAWKRGYMGLLAV